MTEHTMPCHNGNLQGDAMPSWRLPEVTPSWVRSQLIGDGALIPTPFGERPIVYADHVASGRSLRWIEQFILEEVLPYYGNTHTEDSFTGACTTALVQDAAHFIKLCLGARDCKLLFCGTGCTGAIRRLQEILGLCAPETQHAQWIASMKPVDRPLVFVGPYEHHSNEISWRETLAEVIELPLDRAGGIDLDALHSALAQARPSGRLLIGSFSAASNVTGMLSDTRQIARVLHTYGALAFFDFAAAAPHTDIDMRLGAPDGYDAIFLSAHKLPGGPGTPGLLAFDPALYRLRAPSMAGGGTVTYVSSTTHDFAYDIEQREDAGTPGAVQRIRAGLAFLVRQSVGVARIEQLERDLIRRAISRLRTHPRIEILGNLDAPRLAILSFLIRTAEGKYLHPKLVVRLFNDLFGIQTRGGCACAGPYAHRLLDIAPSTADQYRDAVLRGYGAVKPGWTRLNFSYFIDDAEFEYILTAIEYIAEHGEHFLPEYSCDWSTGAWHHAQDMPQPHLWSLTGPSPKGKVQSAWTFQQIIERSRALLEERMSRRQPRPAPVPTGLSRALVNFAL